MSQKFPDYRIFVCRRPNGAPTNLTNDENPKPSGPVALLHIARSRSPNRTGRHAEIRRNKTLPGTTHDPRKRHPDDSGHLCADTCHRARWSWEEVPQHNVRNFYDIGFRLFQLDFWLSDICPRTARPLDVSLAQKQIRGVLDVAPDACIILRVHTDAPYWWNEANRDQCTEYADGPIQEYYKPGPPHNNEDFSIMRSLRASLASQKWKQEAGEKLVEFCKKLSQTEEGDAVIGMHISGGIYGEWHYWGFVDHDPDTGKAMTAYFRNWLRNKYGTDKKLQQAWNSAQWTLETATVPGVEERTKTQFGQFKDPKAERRVIDYTAAQQRLWSKTSNTSAGWPKRVGPAR